MANTYTQICIHIVFAVQGRQDVIGQEGFGAFSYSHSQLRTVIRYIQNQQEHHQRKSFNQEYVELGLGIVQTPDPGLKAWAWSLAIFPVAGGDFFRRRL
jgi:hypothetical protein